MVSRNLSFFKAFASICLILSRVTSNACPTSSKAEKMAKVLGVSPVWLMGFDVPKVDWMVTDKDGNSYMIEMMEPHDKVYDLSADYRRLSPESQKRLLAYMQKLLELDKMEGGDPK